MPRKKWTPQTAVTESLIRIREKRKWQIALRRYVLEKKWSAAYAPYFGLDIVHFREWIALQFAEDLSWENFAEKWQFDHVVPLAYFDFDDTNDLAMCWNFTNIRVAPLEVDGKDQPSLDTLGAKNYFDILYTRTGYKACRNMLDKISRIEKAQVRSIAGQEAFLNQQSTYLRSISGFSAYEFEQLNEGVSLQIVLESKAFAEKITDQNEK